MKESNFSLTPALLVCAAFPVLFLVAPDGIPCVYALCATDPVAGSVTNLTVLSCRNCSAQQGFTDTITVGDCSATKAIGFCEINGSATLTITGQCDALWRVTCSGTECAGSAGFALRGPSVPTPVHFILNCGANGDFMFIEILGANGQPGTNRCDCVPNGGQQGEAVFSASAFCNI